MIALLYAVGGTASATDFQKLLFLYCQTYKPPEQETLNSTYEFVPYQYGAFSFSSYHDKKRLTRKSVLLSTRDDWELSKNGKKIANGYVDDAILSFSKEFQEFRGRKLIAESYRRYPYYAIRSSIRNDVLADDRSALKRIEALKPSVLKRRLFTIGYELRSLENYLNQLILNDVTVLIDVRRNPVSRRYGFSKRTLSSACEKMNIEYRHMPTLGIDSQQRRNLSSSRDYGTLFNKYNRFLLDCCADHIDEILDTVQQDENVALTCYERNPKECHRHVLAKVMSERGNLIAENAPLQQVSFSSLRDVEVRHL